MKKLFDQFLVRIAPFLGLGIFVVLLVVGLVVFSYLLVIGGIVGLVLYIIFWIYSRIVRRRRSSQHPPGSGRIIDHDKQ